MFDSSEFEAVVVVMVMMMGWLHLCLLNLFIVIGGVIDGGVVEENDIEEYSEYYTPRPTLV